MSMLTFNLVFIYTERVVNVKNKSVRIAMISSHMIELFNIPLIFLIDCFAMLATSLRFDFSLRKKSLEERFGRQKDIFLVAYFVKVY